MTIVHSQGYLFLFLFKDLITDLKENLSHHFKEVMVGLMYPPALYDAHELWHALKVILIFRIA